MLHFASALLLAGGAHAAGAARRLQQSIGTMEGTLTAETAEFDLDTPAACTSVMAGCTGTFVELQHNVGGEVTVIDDCTFRIQMYTFDGLGPAVEWWAAEASGDPAVWPYLNAAGEIDSIKIAELGAPGSYVAGSDAGGSGDVTVRLGQDANGEQILLSPQLNHISLWCEEFDIDFGNALLECPAAGAGPAPAPAAAVAADPAAAPVAAATTMAPAPAPASEDAAATGTVTDSDTAATSTSGNADSAAAGTDPSPAGAGPAESAQAPAGATDAAHHAAGAVAAAVAGVLLATAL